MEEKEISGFEKEIRRIKREGRKRMKENMKRMIDSMPAYHLGYIAGIIDGEGTFHIRKRINPAAKKTYIRGYGWEYYVTISSTDFSLLESLRFPVNIIKLKVYGNRKPAYRINIYPTILKHLLPKLSLIVKEKHRKLFLEILDIMDKRNNSKIKNKKTNRFIGTRIDNKDEKRIIEIHKKIRKLNLRGLVRPGGVKCQKKKQKTNK